MRRFQRFQRLMLAALFAVTITVQADSGDCYWECGPIGSHPDCEEME